MPVRLVTEAKCHTSPAKCLLTRWLKNLSNVSILVSANINNIGALEMGKQAPVKIWLDLKFKLCEGMYKGNSFYQGRRRMIYKSGGK